MPFLVASRADLTHYDASCRNVFTTVQKPLQTRAQLCAVLWSTRRLFRPFPGSWNAFHLYWEIPQEHFNGVQLRTTSPFLPILPADGHWEPPWPGRVLSASSSVGPALLAGQGPSGGSGGHGCERRSPRQGSQRYNASLALRKRFGFVVGLFGFLPLHRNVFCFVQTVCRLFST